MAQTGSGNPGSFANDRDKASEAGKKGGEHSGGSQSAGGTGSHSSGSHGTGSQSTGGQGGTGQGSGSGGNFANDREKASEAGKKGGQHSHGS